MKLPIVKHILVFTTWGQKCPHSEPEQFTFDNFQSSHPVAIRTYAHVWLKSMLGNNVIDTNDFLCNVLVQSCQKKRSNI